MSSRGSAASGSSCVARSTSTCPTRRSTSRSPQEGERSRRADPAVRASRRRIPSTMPDFEETRYRPADGPNEPTHDAAFVARAIETLRAQGLDVWLFGGWAEEVLGLTEPWPHG